MTAWPPTLPLPLLNTAGNPLPANLVSPAETATIQRRRRYTASVNALQAQWIFTIAQFESFQSFFTEDLGLGAALFTIELKYPYNSSLTEWRVRLTSGYAATYLDGNWSVEAELELVSEVVAMSIPSDPVDWQPFYVADAEEGSVPFYEAPNNPFYVHI